MRGLVPVGCGKVMPRVITYRFELKWFYNVKTISMFNLKLQPYLVGYVAA
jgi:hypothetical protein